MAEAAEGVQGAEGDLVAVVDAALKLRPGLEDEAFLVFEFGVGVEAGGAVEHDVFAVDGGAGGFVGGDEV